MAAEAKDPVFSMGDDTPLAVLSQQPRRLYSYFKQLFAQVTNPPIDPIREERVMSLGGFAARLNSARKRPTEQRVNAAKTRGSKMPDLGVEILFIKSR